VVVALEAIPTCHVTIWKGEPTNAFPRKKEGILVISELEPYKVGANEMAAMLRPVFP